MNLATPLTLKLVSQAKTVLCLFFGLILAYNVNASVTTTLWANALTPYNNTDEGDLKLTASGTPANVNIWQFASTTFTITNEGLASMSGIEVTLNFPATDDAVLQGGNEYQASQGTLNASWTATPLWSVGTLAAGQSATLQLNIFTKTTGTIIYYGQVSSADGTDADSTPGNGTCCTPNEDDEAVFTFNGTSPPGSSCAFFTYNPSQNTSSLDHALLSMEETTAGYTVHFVDRLSGNIPGNSTEGSYGIDPEGNLISETEMPVTLPYDVSVVVNADQTIDLVFDVSPDLPAGTVVPNVFSYPGADAILPNSKATKTSTGSIRKNK